MTLLESLLLGIVQGATEFLPISSSGHLVLGQYVLELREPDPLFDVLLHVGTLLAVVGFYRRDVADVVSGLREGVGEAATHGDWKRAFEPEGARLSALIVVASVPTAVLGAMVEAFLHLDRGSASAARFVCIALLVNGAVLFASRHLADEGDDERTGTLTLWNISPTIALLLGIAQGVAVLPGLSRSGLTIVAALTLGVWRSEAARFSFLMSIPAILGALMLRFEPSAVTGGVAASTWGVFGVGVVAAALVGYVAILYLVRLVRRAQFHHFSWYCWALGGGGLLYLWIGS
jgi:undecaprenyl-diphosphatase